MLTALPALLALLQSLVPALGTSSAVGKVISSLVEIAPLLIKEAQDVAPMIKNIVAALRANPATTSSQLDDLDALETKIDAEFDAAAEAAQREDSAG